MQSLGFWETPLVKGLSPLNKEVKTVLTDTLSLSLIVIPLIVQIGIILDNMTSYSCNSLKFVLLGAGCLAMWLCHLVSEARVDKFMHMTTEERKSYKASLLNPALAFFAAGTAVMLPLSKAIFKSTTSNYQPNPALLISLTWGILSAGLYVQAAKVNQMAIRKS